MNPNVRAVQRDFAQPWKIRRTDRQQHAQAGVREPYSQRAADDTQQHAFDQKTPDDPSAARAERRTQRQLPLPHLRPNQQQIRHVGAGDEHHQADGRHHHPQHVGHAADHFLFERTKGGRDFPGLVDSWIRARSIRPGVHPDRNHSRHVGVGLGDRDSRLEPGDALIVEPPRPTSVIRSRSNASGKIISASALTILNPWGITPTISFGRVSTMMVRPITDRSPPKRRCQYP